MLRGLQQKFGCLRVFCFTFIHQVPSPSSRLRVLREGPDNLLMWSHYAEQRKGGVLEFESKLFERAAFSHANLKEFGRSPSSSQAAHFKRASGGFRSPLPS